MKSIKLQPVWHRSSSSVKNTPAFLPDWTDHPFLVSYGDVSRGICSCFLCRCLLHRSLFRRHFHCFYAKTLLRTTVYSDDIKSPPRAAAECAHSYIVRRSSTLRARREPAAPGSHCRRGRLEGSSSSSSSSPLGRRPFSSRKSSPGRAFRVLSDGGEFDHPSCSRRLNVQGCGAR